MTPRGRRTDSRRLHPFETWADVRAAAPTPLNCPNLRLHYPLFALFANWWETTTASIMGLCSDINTEPALILSKGFLDCADRFMIRFA